MGEACRMHVGDEAKILVESRLYLMKNTNYGTPNCLISFILLLLLSQVQIYPWLSTLISLHSVG
jgi:hypothetical protein